MRKTLFLTTALILSALTVHAQSLTVGPTTANPTPYLCGFASTPITCNGAKITAPDGTDLGTVWFTGTFVDWQPSAAGNMIKLGNGTPTSATTCITTAVYTSNGQTSAPLCSFYYLYFVGGSGSTAWSGVMTLHFDYYYSAGGGGQGGGGAGWRRNLTAGALTLTVPTISSNGALTGPNKTYCQRYAMAWLGPDFYFGVCTWDDQHNLTGFQPWFPFGI